MRIPGATRITSPRPEKNPAIHYPTSDGKPMAETQVHVDLIIELISTLRHFFRRREKKVLVIGNIFLYFEEGTPRARGSLCGTGIEPKEIG